MHLLVERQAAGWLVIDDGRDCLLNVGVQFSLALKTYLEYLWPCRANMLPWYHGTYPGIIERDIVRLSLIFAYTNFLNSRSISRPAWVRVSVVLFVVSVFP